jgi:hypothetical protein
LPALALRLAPMGWIGALCPRLRQHFPPARTERWDPLRPPCGQADIAVLATRVTQQFAAAATGLMARRATADG